MKQVDFCHVEGKAVKFKTGEAAIFICPYCGPLNTVEKRQWHTPNADAWVINAINWAAEHWEKVDSANDQETA